MSDSTPKQIGNVVNVDRMDSLDRQKLDPEIKLQLLMAEAKTKFGRDPRSGGFAIVGRPRVILQLCLDLGIQSAFTTKIRPERPVIVGKEGADGIGWWQDVPIIMRSSCTSDHLYCLPRQQIPESKIEDRRQASRLRMAIHNGGDLQLLREEN